jgi:hypothetical protein
MMFEKIAEQLIWRAVPGLAIELFQRHRDELLEKGAESPILKQLAVLGQLQPGKMFGLIPNAPGPLTSMLVGGLAGAGLGYGAGALGEQLFPQQWERGRLRKTLAMLGGGLGVLPGATLATSNVMAGRPFYSGKLLGAGYEFPDYQKPERRQVDFTDPQGRGRSAIDSGVKVSWQKVAALPTTGVLGMRPIDVNEFNQVIWRDPRVARPMSDITQAAASGLLTSAASLPGRRPSGLVTPMDVGRLTAGMGTGYLSGMLVGKALGLLTGMPDTAQERLKNTGMWAGIVSAVVPIAFGQ